MELMSPHIDGVSNKPYLFFFLTFQSKLVFFYKNLCIKKYIIVSLNLFVVQKALIDG